MKNVLLYLLPSFSLSHTHAKSSNPALGEDLREELKLGDDNRL